MPAWGDLQNALANIPPEKVGAELSAKIHQCTQEIADLSECNVLYYASGFLQKPLVASLFTSITPEDINGFMAGLHGLDFSKKLLLILHTPGGQAEAAQSIVEYLRSKFGVIDAVIPTYAMSAGTMIALGCNRIIMGRQSQLGPTDPQLVFRNRQFSAHSIVSQFEEAKADIAQDAALAHAWAPVLQSYGPALLQEARKAIGYGQNLVQKWLGKYMFASRSDSAELAKRAAASFDSEDHGSHGSRIDRETARRHGLEIADLEDSQNFQDKVLTLYHLSTIVFEQGPSMKFIVSSNKRTWIKDLQTAAMAQH